MLYESTRNRNLTANGPEAILQGIAPDGGLYMIPDVAAIPFDWKALLELDTIPMAAEILSALLPDFSKDEMKILCEKAYTGKFESDDLTPLAQVGDRYVLELFRGPTSAFKDVALSMLPQLMTASRGKTGMKEEICILTATSGDTGKAALEGFHDVEGIKILVYYPNNGVSAVQKAQMVTQTGNNVAVVAINGNFDDAQTGDKNPFAAAAEGQLDPAGNVVLSSANSINIGRLAPQVVYYFKAYADLVREGRITCGDQVTYVVPTGNFGDILAGYFAKKLGLPVGKLICASNTNKVLTDFFEKGVYDRRRPFFKTDSPSMDILISSNLERLLYMVSGDTDLVASLMKQLKEEGHYTLSAELMDKINAEFGAGFCTDEEGAAAIAKVWKDYGYLMDPHTAVAWKVSEDYTAAGNKEPVVVLSTASPFKFPNAVLKAMGAEPVENEFDCLEQLSALSHLPIPKNLANLKEAKVLHTTVIEKEDVVAHSLKKAGERQW